MINEYEKYLISIGYKQTTPSGHPSTVYQYLKAIRNVCDEEGINLIELKENIISIILKYDIGGEKETIGAKSHKTVINALKRFEDFLKL